MEFPQRDHWREREIEERERDRERDTERERDTQKKKFDLGCKLFNYSLVMEAVSKMSL